MTYLTPKDLAKHFGVSTATINRRIKAGKIVTHQIGGIGRKRIPAAELKRLAGQLETVQVEPRRATYERVV